jgi:hypothetical protein
MAITAAENSFIETVIEIGIVNSFYAGLQHMRGIQSVRVKK